MVSQAKRCSDSIRGPSGVQSVHSGWSRRDSSPTENYAEMKGGLRGDGRTMFDALPVLLTLPDPFTTEQAIAAGLTQHVVERLVRNGDVLRVRRGLFRRPPTSDVVGERWMQIRRDHLTRARLALLAHPNHALSHRTAAVAFGWPVSLHPDALVHLTALTVEPRSRRIADRYLHHSDSIVNDVEMVDGLRVLTRDRTVADCLRTMRAASAVAIADAAVREGPTTTLQVERVLAAQRHWLGADGEAISALG